MANAVTNQTLVDGPRNLVVKLVGVLDTSNEAKALKVDISTYVPASTVVRIDKIFYNISSQLAVQLYWDATSDVVIVALVGYGTLDATKYGGLLNNAGTGVTGDIELATTGWASGTQTYTIILEMTKTGTINPE